MHGVRRRIPKTKTEVSE